MDVYLNTSQRNLNCNLTLACLPRGILARSAQRGPSIWPQFVPQMCIYDNLILSLKLGVIPRMGQPPYPPDTILSPHEWLFCYLPYCHTTKIPSFLQFFCIFWIIDAIGTSTEWANLTFPVKPRPVGSRKCDQTPRCHFWGIWPSMDTIISLQKSQSPFLPVHPVVIIFGFPWERLRDFTFWAHLWHLTSNI